MRPCRRTRSRPLYRERDRLFPDEMFADLFSDRGRRSVPPSVVAVVLVLQRLEGLSNREAVERYAQDRLPIERIGHGAGIAHRVPGIPGLTHTI